MNRTALAAIWPPTAGAAKAAGHARMSPIQAIRRKCLDCTGHQPAEVRYCEAVTCPLWPFRAGRHPYTRRGLQEADSGQDMAGGGPVSVGDASSETTLQEAGSGEGVEYRGQPTPLPGNDTDGRDGHRDEANMRCVGLLPRVAHGRGAS